MVPGNGVWEYGSIGEVESREKGKLRTCEAEKFSQRNNLEF